MQKIPVLFFTALVAFASCKKQRTEANNFNPQLYPLTAGNKWIYVDSFFNERGFFYGLDTFTLKTVKTISVNNQVYTPVTDQYDDSIFTVRSTDSTVYLLKKPGEVLLFKLPLAEGQPTITNSYYGDTLRSEIFTERNIRTPFPSYKIIITYDDGLWYHYKQQELFFTIGIGIIKGRDFRKTNAGISYPYDSYRLITYGLK
jgi:hypothetical protein